MRYVKLPLRKSLLGTIVLVIVLFYPAAAFADSSTPPSSDPSSTASTDSSSTTPAPDPTTGPQRPPGADSNTYQYNAATGLWENDYYTWDPVTHQTAPKTAPDYSYNPATGMWDTTQWRFDAANGTYVPNTVSVSTPPAGAAIIAPASSDSGPAATSAANLNSPVNSPANNNPSSAYNLFYNANISGVINSSATTGSALIQQNTSAGDALTGNAQAIANVINLLQSSWNPATMGNLATFISNINGDVTGDIQIDPGQIGALGQLSVSNPSPANLTVNDQTNSSINNQITVGAASGNATLDSNTAAGNATTGSAAAIANVVNMINSTIASGQSFVGMININGSLNGDILLPPDLIMQLLADNSVPKTTIDTSRLANGSVLADFNNNQSITNHITSSAGSGAATVSNNTTAGNATTGNASTNLTLMNLTGQQIIGQDALLVFVNVLGQWVGLIMNAPAGTTSAALGGGITSDTALPGNTALNSTNNSSITNDIALSAHSGDATVTDNTTAGNATTGAATTSVNLLNLINTQLSLSKWFGILFINVFGTWHGSFGVNTSAGDVAGAPGASAIQDVKVFQFVPGGSTSHPHVASVSATNDSGSSSPTAHLPSAVLATATLHKPPLASSNTSDRGNHANWWLIFSGALGVACVGWDWKYRNRTSA